MEGIHKEYQINWSMLGELWRALRQKHSLIIRDWIFTDFDHCLQGNPIMRREEQEEDK